MTSNGTSSADHQLAARRILSVNEEELQRLILDLHDGPVQQLFAAQSQISILQQRAARGDALTVDDYSVTLQRVTRLQEEALREIRHFVGTFRPPDFAHRDMVSILQGLLLHYELTTGCAVEFDAPVAAVPAPLPVKITLYRICQEALSNAYRHAGATRQAVRLLRAEGALVLEVSDNGAGFVPPPLRGPDATERHEHIGLRGMRDRVDLVDGTFELDSAPGQGTRVVVRVPIDDEPDLGHSGG